MPIQFGQIPRFTPEELNPNLYGFLNGLGQGANFAQQARMFPLEMQKQQIANQLEEYKRQQAEAEAPYYGEMAGLQAQLARMKPKEAQLKMEELAQQMKFNPSLWQAQINLQNATSNKYNTMTPLEAEKARIENKYLPQMQESQIDQNKALATYRKSGGSSLGVAGQNLLALDNQISIENPGFDNIQINQARNAYLEGKKQLPDGTILKPPSGTIKSLLDINARQRYTTSGIDQQRYAETLDAILNQGSELMPSVAKYAGSLGKVKGSIDKIKSSLGENSQDYQNYFNFTRTVVPSVAGELLRTLGSNATDKQKEMMKNLADPLTWDSNPKIAMENYKYLIDLYTNTITKSIKKSVSDILLGKNEKSNNNVTTKPIKLVLKNGMLVRE